MSDEILSHLNSNQAVLESYVLRNELRIILKSGVDYFNPTIKVRIWYGPDANHLPYSFELSHHVKTPKQQAPYHPSRVSFDTESEAIDAAVSATITFIESAIQAGNEPSGDWLVRNEDF